MLELEQKIISPVARSSWFDRLAGTLQDFLHELFRGSEAGRNAKDFLNGVWFSHPLHPAVTDIPMGAWTAAVALDAVESVTGRDLQQCTSAAIGVGIGGAALSAASGMADWADLRGEQRRVGMVHAISNLLATALFSASLMRRLSGNRSGSTALSTAGFLSLMLGGYLGGDLTYRLGTQVNRNAWAREAGQFVPVMREEELPPEQPKRVDVRGIPVMLVRHGDAIYAMNEVCSHAGGPLSEGRLEDGNIVCPWHGSTYKLEDGSVVHGPSPFHQTHYKVRVREGQIEVRAEPARV